MSDTFIAYENGLRLLLQRVDKQHPAYPRIISNHTSLQENIAQTQLAGESQERSAERKRIVTDLNDATKQIIGISFIDLCILTYITTVQETVLDAHKVFDAKKPIWPDQCEHINGSFYAMSHVLDNLTVDMLDVISIEFDHIDDCIIRITGLLEDFKEVCQKPSRQSQVQRQQILHKLTLLIGNLERVNSAFRGFTCLDQDEGLPTNPVPTTEQPQLSTQGDNQGEVQTVEIYGNQSESKEQDREQMVDQTPSIELRKDLSIDEVNLANLRKVIEQAFDLGELEDLCVDIEQDLQDNGIDLRVNLDMIGGESRLPSKVRALIGYLERRGYFSYLVAAVRKARPGISF